MWIRKFPLMNEAGEGGEGNGSGGSGEGGAGNNEGGAGGAGGAGETNWREPFAAGDEKRAKALERFTKPEDFAKSYFEAAERIRAGDLLKPLPKDATEDDIKAYREQVGIPLEVKGYFENVPEGLVLGEDDQPIIEQFAERLHKINAPPSVVHEAIAWYNEYQQAEVEKLAELDKAQADEVSQTLRDEWGAEYRVNMNIAKSVLADLPQEARERFINARTGEGKALFNDPDIVRWLADKGRELNPAASIMPAGATDDKSVDNRIKEIEGWMGTPKYTKDEKVQAELRKLYEIREKRKEQRAA